jgi:hypothetical protein
MSDSNFALDAKRCPSLQADGFDSFRVVFYFGSLRTVAAFDAVQCEPRTLTDCTLKFL